MVHGKGFMKVWFGGIFNPKSCHKPPKSFLLLIFALVVPPTKKSKGARRNEHPSAESTKQHNPYTLVCTLVSLLIRF